MMITSYDRQTIANGFIQDMVKQEVEKRMTAFYFEQAMKMGAKDAEIADLKEKIRILEERASRNYERLSEVAESTYGIKQPGFIHRMALRTWACMVIIGRWWLEFCGMKLHA